MALWSSEGTLQNEEIKRGEAIVLAFSLIVGHSLSRRLFKQKSVFDHMIKVAFLSHVKDALI
ncbi:hypothetical protein LG202_07230 [Methylobacillus methanolivorans]